MYMGLLHDWFHGIPREMCRVFYVHSHDLPAVLLSPLSTFVLLNPAVEEFYVVQCPGLFLEHDNGLTNEKA